MDIEVKVDENYTTPKIIIYTNKINKNLSNIIDGLSYIDYKKLKAYKNEVKNIDFKIIGTIILNFKSGNKAYASRRYIPKIKEFFEI